MLLLPTVAGQGYKVLYLRVCTAVLGNVLLFWLFGALQAAALFSPCFLVGFACLILIPFESPFTYFMVRSLTCLVVLPKTTLVFLFLFFLIAFGWFPGRECTNAHLVPYVETGYFYLKFGCFLSLLFSL